MKKILIMVMVCLSVALYAQKEEGCSKGRIAGAGIQFNEDLEANTLKIYTLGGLMPANAETDRVFEEKYGIKYHNFGCLAPVNMDYYNAYNLFVFSYLSKHNNNWKNEIRKDAMGFTRWNESN